MSGSGHIQDFLPHRLSTGEDSCVPVGSSCAVLQEVRGRLPEGMTEALPRGLLAFVG